MAGYSKFYVFGGAAGFQGADGVHPIAFLVLVGDGGRQWLEPHYFDPAIEPIGRIRTIVPDAPGGPDALLDAFLAFHPSAFESCPSMAAVREALKDATSLDLGSKDVPRAWRTLRQEARPLFEGMMVWEARLEPLMRS
jgi:hypothetical protein